MRQLLIGLGLVAFLAACSGGNSGSKSVPIVSQSSTPATPAPQGTNKLAAAPATIYTATGPQSISWKKAQSIRAESVNLGSGGIPTVVVGYSATMGAYFSQLYTWAENAQATPVPEASAQATATGPMTIQAINQDNTDAFALTYFDWIINPGPLTGGGKIEVTVTFADGTTGQVPYYSYDKWSLGCNGGTPSQPVQIAYQAGVLVGQVLPADVSLDCAGQNLDFPNGALLLQAPAADAYGNYASQFTSVLSVSTASTPTTAVPLAQLQVGAVYLVKLNDGGFAKFMLMSPVLVGGAVGISFDGIALHDSPSGSGKFPF